MGDKKKNQPEEVKVGEGDAKDTKVDKQNQIPNIDESVEKVFRDVALIDSKENIDGVIKEIVREVRAMKASSLTAQEMAQLVFQNMKPAARDHMLAGLLAEIFEKQAKMRSRHTRDMDELSPDVGKGAFPYLHNYDDDLYKEELYALQVELLKMQRYVKDAGLKIAVIFEGRDAAGKGSTIARFTQNINRGAVVLPALCGAAAESRRDGLFRPILVQPRRGGTGYGLLPS